MNPDVSQSAAIPLPDQDRSLNLLIGELYGRMHLAGNALERANEANAQLDAENKLLRERLAELEPPKPPAATPAPASA